MKRMDTSRIVTLGLLISLNIILVRFASVRISIGGVEGIRIGLGSFPVVFTGLFFGPLAGGIVGAIGDVLGFILNPMGLYMPHFTFSAAMTGIIPGLVLNLMGRERVTFSRLFLACGAGLFVTSIILVPLFLKILFGIPLWTTLPPRMISLCFTVPIYALFAYRIGKRVPSALAEI